MDELFFIDIKWLEILIGAIFSFILTNIPQIKSAISFVFKDPYNIYYGDIYIYGYPVIGNTSNYTVLEHHMSIKKNIFGLPKVETISYTEQSYKYRGHLEGKASNIYIYLNGIEHEENLLYIMNKPLSHGDYNKTLCICAMVTPEMSPVSTVNLVSNKHINAKDVKEIFPRRRVTIIERSSNENGIATLLLKDGSIEQKLGFTQKNYDI